MSYIRTPEMREQARLRNLGKTASEETRKKLSLKLKGKKKSAHMRAALSAARKGVPHTESARRNILIGQRRRRSREAAEAALRPARMTACERCGHDFKERRQYSVPTGFQRFCSRECGRQIGPRQSEHLGQMQEFMRNCIHRLGVNTKGLDAFRRHSTKILGYTKEELRTRLEAQFVDGMSWENYGGRQHGKGRRWVIDHIRPISVFIREGIMDPKIVNALNNLQPLWSRDNTVKRARLV